MAKARIITCEVPGPRSKHLRKTENGILAPGLQRFAVLSGLTLSHGNQCTVTDVDGNRYIDLIGGIGVNSLGHSHPAYIRAIHQQLKRLSVGSFTSKPRIRLLQRLVKHSPSLQLNRVQLYSSGAEAVESSLRLAKSRTGKFEFVSFWGGFHGKTLGALSLMGSSYKNLLGPMASGCHQVPYAYCYRCPFRLKYPSCGMACLEFVRKQIKVSTSGAVAAFIIEPMQGTHGNVIPPKEFLPGVLEIAREVGALFIADEMITGFGRTGKYWGSDHSQVKPDILVIGKQLGGGAPISGIISTDRIVHSQPWSAPSGSSSSFGGNPFTAAAAAVTLKLIDREHLVANSRRMGSYLLKKLMPFLEKYPFVGDIRGAGLFLGIELVKNKKSKEPLSKKTCLRLFQACLKRGLLTMAYDSKFRIQPPMIIDRKTIDESVEILEEAFNEIRSPRDLQ